MSVQDQQSMLKSAVTSSPYFTLNHHGPSCVGVRVLVRGLLLWLERVQC